MIRALALIVALVLGASAAALTQTKVSHLRVLVPDRLPAWTTAFAPRAGLFSGAMNLAALPGVTLRWSAVAPGRGGLRWRITLQGNGVDLAGDLLVAFDLSTAQVSEVTGTISLADLRGAPGEVRGLFEILSGSADLQPLPNVTQIRADLSGRVAGAAYQVTELGDGPFRAEMDPLGSWRANLSLSGGGADVEAAATGRLYRDGGGVKMTITDAGAMPAPWKSALSLAGARSGDTWTIDQAVSWKAILNAATGLN